MPVLKPRQAQTNSNCPIYLNQVCGCKQQMMLPVMEKEILEGKRKEDVVNCNQQPIVI